MLIDRYTKAVLVVYPFQDALLSHLLQKKCVCAIALALRHAASLKLPANG